VITIELPLPHQDEHPNARPHWRAKAKAKKKTRGDAHFMTTIRMDLSKSDLRFPLKKPTYKVEFYLPRKRDEDGLIAWIKAQIDGIADAGLICNDSELKLSSVAQTSGCGATGGKYFVRYTIWSLE
jgi:hypothetical protein